MSEVCPRCQGLLLAEEEAWEHVVEVRCVNCGWRPLRAAPRPTQSYGKVVRYRRAQRAKGLCLYCPGRATDGAVCRRHYEAKRRETRLRMRAKAGYQAWRPGGLGRPPKERV